MMTRKIVIANDKWGDAGKTTSIRYAYQILSARYKTTVLLPQDGARDPGRLGRPLQSLLPGPGEIVSVPSIKSCQV